MHIAVCIIAHDAKVKNGEYVGVGKNSKTRITDAMELAAHEYRGAHLVWYCGAGAQDPRAITMLAQCNIRYLLSLNPSCKTIANESEPLYWGTLEEIAWIVKSVEKTHRAGDIRFAFFTQRRHMMRVKLIWKLLYESKWGHADFHITLQKTEISLIHEFGGILKTLGVYLGLWKPRYVYK